MVLNSLRLNLGMFVLVVTLLFGDKWVYNAILYVFYDKGGDSLVGQIGAHAIAYFLGIRDHNADEVVAIVGEHFLQWLEGIGKGSVIRYIYYFYGATSFAGGRHS